MVPPSPLDLPRWARVVSVAACAALGWGVWEAAARAQPEADPARWVLGASSVPTEAPTLGGPLRPDPAALDLWAYRSASPRIDPFAAGTLALTARVPDDGQLVVRFGATVDAGPVQPVRAGEGAPPPGPAPRGGVALVVDRTARASISARGFRCGPAPAPPERFRLDVAVAADGLDVAIDGVPVTRCVGTVEPGAIVFGASVRRVQITDVAVTPAGGGAPFTDTFGGPARTPLAGALAALLGAALGARVRRRAVAVALAPLLLLPLLGRVDMRALLDTLRLLAVPEAYGPALLVGLPTTAALLLVAGAAAPTLPRAAARGLAGLVPAALAASLGPADAAGWLLLGALGPALAALGWINTHPFARRVPASYALTLLLAAGAEGAVRLTALDSTWTRTAGWRRASEEFAELVEIRRWRSYPDEGFPVQPPAPTGKRRIVALGGSSTGGAYQMDDLDQFWPRRLEERLAGTDWEVVNQGVGGWNTLHVRLYLESQIERLDPDLLVLYVGHNDSRTAAPVPYRELYARWRAPSSRARTVAAALNTVRLYVGLKYALFALRGGNDGAVAVPLADARDNLGAIAGLAAARGARVLFVNEANNPDPDPMRPYGELLANLAEETGNHALDAADRFGREANPDHFIDNVHLSVLGHTTLAAWIHDALRETAWLDAPAAAAP